MAFSLFRFPLALALLGLTAMIAIAADIPTVTNPLDAPVHETLVLEEAWRVGGEDESDVLLGQIGVAIAGPGGEVYALDSQLSQVQVFDPTGKHLRTVGRRGDGPGEFRQPVGLFLPGDGSLAVQEAFPGRISYLDPVDGTPRDIWELGNDDPQSGGMAFMETARRRGGTFVVAAASTAFDMETREIRSTSYLAVIDETGGEKMRLAEVPSVRSMIRFTIDELVQYNPGERGLWDIAPDGRIYVAPRYDAYEIAIYNGDGALEQTFTRRHEARVRTEAEKEEQRGSMQMNINGQIPEIEWKLQDRARCIERLQVLDDGTVWVLNSNARAAWNEAGTVIYDVFDPDGKLLREVTVAVPEGGDGDRLVLMDDGRFLLINGMDSLSISISVGGGDNDTHSDEELGDTLLELVCYEVVH